MVMSTPSVTSIAVHTAGQSDSVARVGALHLFLNNKEKSHPHIIRYVFSEPLCCIWIVKFWVNKMLIYE